MINKNFKYFFVFILVGLLIQLPDFSFTEVHAEIVREHPTGEGGGGHERENRPNPYENNNPENETEESNDESETNERRGEGGVALRRPSLSITSTGKVNLTDEDGNVLSKGALVTEGIDRYRFVIAGVSGVGAVSMILFFILNFMKLGATSGNPQGRGQAILGLILTGVAATGLGAVSFITGVFYNAL